MYGLYLENIMLPITAYCSLLLKIVKKQMSLNFSSSALCTHAESSFMSLNGYLKFKGE